MNKTVMILFAALTAMLSAQADPVSMQQAMQTAQQFVGTHRPAPIGGVRMAAKSTDLSAQLQSEAYYIFNVGQQNGYVIVSADDSAMPILGYADTGSFDADCMPDAMRQWLSLYEAEIRWMAEQPKPALVSADTNTPPATVRIPIAPMLTSEWGQNFPYNLQTPLIDDRNAPTGCAATAMAQIMRYRRLPEGSTPAIPAYGKADEELPPTTFDWDAMPDVCDSLSDEASKDAVAALMRYAGQAAKTEYSQGGSGTYTSAVCDAMRTCFGFEPSTHVADRDRYTARQWEDLIYSELQAGRPVFYAGLDELLDGHAFVCDGYETGGYFHINWGWQGSQDGFFLLSALSPLVNMQGYLYRPNFRVIQQVIVGTTHTEPTIVDGEPKLKVQSLVFDCSHDLFDFDHYLTLTNEAETDYVGNIWYSYDYGMDDNPYFTKDLFYFERVELGAGETKRILLHLTQPADTCVIGLDQKGQNIIYLGGVEGLRQEVTAEAWVENVDSTQLVGRMVKIHARLSNHSSEEFYKTVICEARRVGQQRTEARDWARWQVIPAGGVGEYDFLFTLNGDILDELLDTEWYFVIRYYNGKWKDDGYKVVLYRSPVYHFARGTVFYQADGTVGGVGERQEVSVPSDAVAVDMSDVSQMPTEMTPSQNPNCVYLLNGEQTVPQELTGLNVVVDRQAEHIGLTDGHPFYTPVDIVARRATYERRLPMNEWSTLVLPFAPDEPLADTLCVKQLYAEGNQTAYFNDAFELVPWRPYLVYGQGQTLSLSASDVTLPAKPSATIEAADFNLVGTAMPLSGQSWLTLTPDGHEFAPLECPAAPFRAYAQATGTGLQRIAVNMEGNRPSAIAIPLRLPVSDAPRFTLGGRLAAPSHRGVVVGRGQVGMSSGR